MVLKELYLSGLSHPATAAAVSQAGRNDPLPEQTDAAAFERARRYRAADGHCEALGIELVDIGLGRATLRMRVAEQHMNFHRACHGGAMFSLADTAFGMAANAYGVMAVGIDAHITYQAAARFGDVLEAKAHEVSRSRRLAIYRVDMTRTNTAGETALVSSFTGTVYIK